MIPDAFSIVRIGTVPEAKWSMTAFHVASNEAAIVVGAGDGYVLGGVGMHALTLKVSKASRGRFTSLPGSIDHRSYDTPETAVRSAGCLRASRVPCARVGQNWPGWLTICEGLPSGISSRQVCRGRGHEADGPQDRGRVSTQLSVNRRVREISYQAMGKKRRKPRGRQGVVTLGRNPAFHELHLPEEKSELERAILNGALATAARQKSGDPYGLTKPPEQNKENDFDFTLTTRTGKAYLDLLEAAPLSDFGGRYENVPQIIRVGEMAEAVVALVMKKNAHYQGVWRTPIHLLVYSTDWRLSLSASVLTLLAHWLRTKPHGFATVNYFLPAGVVRSIWHPLFPSSDKELMNINEDEVSSRHAARFDLSAIRREPDGTTVVGKEMLVDLTHAEQVRMDASGHMEYGRFSDKLNPTASASKPPGN